METITQNGYIMFRPAEGGYLVRNNDPRCLYRIVCIPQTTPDSRKPAIREATDDEIKAYLAKKEKKVIG